MLPLQDQENQILLILILILLKDSVCGVLGIVSNILCVQVLEILKTSHCHTVRFNTPCASNYICVLLFLPPLKSVQCLECFGVGSCLQPMPN